MEEGEGERTRLAPSVSWSSSFSCLSLLDFSPLSFATTMRIEEESEKSGTPSRARGRRGRSLALLTRLTAWSARLEPPLIHRQGGMNIYKKLREIVASLVLSRSCPRVVTAPVLLARARVPVLPTCRRDAPLGPLDSSSMRNHFPDITESD